MRRFEDTLRKCFGLGGFPLEIVGDLDDLRFTIARLEEALSAVSRDQDCTAVTKALYDVEFILGDELPLLAADLVPMLKKLRETRLIKKAITE